MIKMKDFMNDVYLLNFYNFYINVFLSFKYTKIKQ